MDPGNNIEAAICAKCKEGITSTHNAVSCDKCQSTFHDSCVKFNDNMQVWRCTVCQPEEGITLQVNAPKSMRSRKSSVFSNTSSKAKQMALQAIEEEQALLEKQAKEKEKLLNETHTKQLEMMKKKQEVIQDMASNSGGSSRSSLKDVASVTGQEKVENWISTQTKHPEIPEQQQSQQKPGCSKEIIPTPQIPKPIGPTEINFAKDGVPSSTQIPEATVLNINPGNSAVPAMEQQRYEGKRSLSREEIASRHVVKGLPKFDGTPKLWPAFISSFNRTTFLCGFNNFENMERLNQSLEGNALAAVQSSLSMEENVPRIIETLALLYGKPEFIINDLLDEVMNSAAPTYENVDSILTFSLAIENISMTMVNAKLAEHLWNPKLLSDMIEKLPAQLKFCWAEYKSTHPPCSIEVFSMWLKNKATAYASILTKPPNIQRSSKKVSKHSLNLHLEEKNPCQICSNSCLSAAECSKFKGLSLQDKWDTIRRFQICRICLTQHPNRRCKVDTRCDVDGCVYRHNKILHNPKKSSGKDDADDPKEPFNVHAGVTTYFKILPVLLTKGNRQLKTYAMFDDGSSLTLMDSTLADKLKLSGEEKPLCLKWTNGMERREDCSKVVSLFISQSSDSQQFRLKNVRTVKNLCLPRQSLKAELLSSMYHHLKGIEIESFENIQPLLLIGLNHSKLMTVHKYRFGTDTEPAAAKTPLGWCIFGSDQNSSETLLHIKQCSCEGILDRRLDEMVRENYTLESIGISTPATIPQAKADLKALEILNSTVKLNDGRFETGLLWKYDEVKLPNSLPMAKRRLKCLEKKIESQPELRNVINNQISDYLSKGYINRLSPDVLQESDAWYLPIFVVRNENKPDKIRMVWDAAAEVGGVSLNHVLLKGPDLISSLPGVLLRFREHRTALTGDIKEMFHQIVVKESDRRYQRFLWRSNEDGEIEVYEMRVMTFGSCCSPSCAQFVKNLNADRFKSKFPAAVEAIHTNHYVDDWLQSVDTPSQAVTLAEQVKKIHQEGGFKIHKWISNSAEVVQSLNSDFDSSGKNMELSPKFEFDKILGMFWTTSSDSFQFVLKLNDSNAKLISGEKTPTKREFLRFLMSIFDPLGLISPVLIYPKILLQSIWRTRTDWDDEIDSEHHNKWLLWAQNLHHLKTLNIPRWVGLCTKGTNIELHVFVDASEDAFAAAVYFKISEENNIKCSLITSKSRVAPIKSLSIPRLELQAAVLGIRLATFVMENSSPAHVFSRRFFWTDSETVTKWLNSDTRKYSQFVACRIGEILEHSKQTEWNWLSGKLNIADMSTKMKIFDDQQVLRWFSGPEFLYDDKYPSENPSSKVCTEELRPQTSANHIAIHEEAEFRVGKWTKLRRVFAFVCRYVMNLQRSIRSMHPISGPLTREEYQKAENYLIKKCQMEQFTEEYRLISAGKKIRDRRSIIYKDSPFVDDNGVLRAKGRIQSAYVHYDMKNPILLPRDHRITEMILFFYHNRYHHQYIATVANEIKQKFVVQRLKVKLKEIRKNCQECKNRDAKPEIPEEAPLPLARLSPFTRPFSYIGIDYFGPIQVIVGRRPQKRWCLLVTCLTTRALHLDVAHTLSTDSCILGLRRFMSRRGKPCEIYSDNGTNFRGSKRELREIWDHINKHQVAETFIDSDTEWKFNPPASPHMGGAWERLVRTVKTSLKAAFPHRLPNDELLLTMLAEVENIINNRPLTYVELEDEYQEALTPNHFLLGSSSGMKPLGEFSDDSAYLRDNWHKSQRFATVFWKRWVAEYLPTLNRRTKWFESSTGELEVGDIVVVLGEVCGSWPKGRVVDVHRGKDNHIRSASVSLETGIYTRPVSKLAKLDVRGQQEIGILDKSSRIPGGSVDTAQNKTSNATTTNPDNNFSRVRSLRALPHRSN